MPGTMTAKETKVQFDHCKTPWKCNHCGIKHAITTRYCSNCATMRGAPGRMPWMHPCERDTCPIVEGVDSLENAEDVARNDVAMLIRIGLYAASHLVGASIHSRLVLTQSSDDLHVRSIHNGDAENPVVTDTVRLMESSMIPLVDRKYWYGYSKKCDTLAVFLPQHKLEIDGQATDALDPHTSSPCYGNCYEIGT